MYFLIGTTIFSILQLRTMWSNNIEKFNLNSSSQFVTRSMVIYSTEIFIYSFIPIFNERENRIDILNGQHSEVIIANIDKKCWYGRFFIGLIAWILFWMNLFYDVSLSFCWCLFFKECFYWRKIWKLYRDDKKKCSRDNNDHFYKFQKAYYCTVCKVIVCDWCLKHHKEHVLVDKSYVYTHCNCKHVSIRRTKSR